MAPRPGNPERDPRHKSGNIATVSDASSSCADDSDLADCGKLTSSCQRKDIAHFSTYEESQESMSKSIPHATKAIETTCIGLLVKL